MFPISLGRGAVADRVLQPDDIAGVSDLYPDGGFRSETGVISGRVRMSGAGVNGAHIVAFNPQSGTLIGNFSSSDGTAFGGTDYTPVSGTLRFDPGVTTQTILVPVLGDLVAEPDETVTVTLSNVTAGGPPKRPARRGGPRP